MCSGAGTYARGACATTGGMRLVCAWARLFVDPRQFRCPASRSHNAMPVRRLPSRPGAVGRRIGAEWPADGGSVSRSVALSWQLQDGRVGRLIPASALTDDVRSRATAEAVGMRPVASAPALLLAAQSPPVRWDRNSKHHFRGSPGRCSRGEVVNDPGKPDDPAEQERPYPGTPLKRADDRFRRDSLRNRWRQCALPNTDRTHPRRAALPEVRPCTYR
jgi:hypothetical protein